MPHFVDGSLVVLEPNNTYQLGSNGYNEGVKLNFRTLASHLQTELFQLVFILSLTQIAKESSEIRGFDGWQKKLNNLTQYWLVNQPQTTVLSRTTSPHICLDNITLGK